MLLYEGKAKQVYSTENENEYVVYYKDDATAFNGEKKASIASKGILNNKICTIMFETLEKAGWNYENIGDIECKGQLEVSQPLVENVLTKTKDIDVVVALNDPSAMGAMAALDAEHMLSDVLVYGADGSPEAKTMIYKNRMTATAAQSPRITGKKTVEMLYKILAGKPVESQYIVPVRLITRDNVEDYSLSGWQ